MRFNGYAREHYENVYPKLTKARGGLVGSIIDRAEAQVIRLCMIYALLDGKEYIEPEHLEAALALWQYCEDAATFIFYDKESNPHERKILAALKSGPKSTTEIYQIFGRKLKKEDIHKAIKELITHGRIETFKVGTGGKPKTMFRLTGDLLNEKQPPKGSF